MDAVSAVTTVLLHAPQLLTVRELMRVSACCREWRSVVTRDLAAHSAACKRVYRFFTAIPRCPDVPTEKRFSTLVGAAHLFSAAQWQPFLAAVGGELSPVQWALYYTYCFWLASTRLSPLWLIGDPALVSREHVTLLLHPCGMVKEMTSKPRVSPPPPYVQFAKEWNACNITLDLTGCAISRDEVDIWLLGAAVYTERRLFDLLRRGHVSDTNLTVLTYAMAPYHPARLNPLTAYAVEEDHVSVTQHVSLQYPLAAGNFILGDAADATAHHLSG